ncbi:hypothetical protein F2P56_036416 [Juglans regia]|nr:hypothetical protein F2P56_036416 [Juglans regia]
MKRPKDDLPSSPPCFFVKSSSPLLCGSSFLSRKTRKAIRVRGVLRPGLRKRTHLEGQICATEMKLQCDEKRSFNGEAEAISESVLFSFNCYCGVVDSNVICNL